MNPILTRVKKLLDLANNAGASEGERENALRMANGMLAKHNLDMADLNKHLEQEGREDYMNATWSMMWCRQISMQIAKLFFCKYYYGKKINGTKCEHHFVGKASNVATAALMSEYVITSILQECRKKWKHNLAPESRSFARGATVTISNRVQEIIKEAKPEGGTSTSLVIVALYVSEMEANEAFIKGQGTSLVSSKVRSSKVDLTAYNAGKEYGGKVGLNEQVANKSQLRLN